MSEARKGTIARAFQAALPQTMPIFAGFTFLGIAYGIYMNVSGFHLLYPMLMSFFIFAGSMEFVAVGLLLGPFDPLHALLLTLMINARHLFYGISMLDRYRGTGWKKPFLIYGMCDESFSINCTADIPEDVDKGWFMLFVTLLNQCYWVLGATLGGLFGSALRFETKGLEFVMTALFVVIFLENFLNEKAHYGSALGLGLSALSLVLFGSGNFIIPAMLMILAALSALRKPLQASGAYR